MLMNQGPPPGGMELLMATCCCGPFVLLGLWFLMIKSSVDRDERKGRCSGCNGTGKAYTVSSSVPTTCQSCGGSGKYRPY
jgi:hypothetical protein